MDLIKTSIRRPVTILMGICIVIILGAVSLNQMKMELFPSADLPYAIIMTSYSGAGPEEVENIVSVPLEGAVARVENIDHISSISSEGSSIVVIQFNYGTNMSDAVNSLRDSVSMVESSLPDEVGSSTIMKLDINAMPITYVTITSDHLGDYELKTLVEDKIQPRLERQTGVASVGLSGGIEKEIRVEIDPERLQGLGLSLAQIGQILAAENMNQPGGSIDYGEKSLTISSKLKMTSIDEVKEIPITLAQGAVIPLQDIAQITEVEKEVDSVSRFNGESCITLSITKASDGNTVATSDAVRAEVAKIVADYPQLNLQVVNDSAEMIKESVYSVIRNILIATVLAILILFVFLKNVGLTGIIAISMPLSIVVTFILLYFSGTTLNILSLGGLSIGVGMLVDNSVVVLENIYRHRAVEGHSKVKGTYRGTKEVILPVMASTLTTIVIFVPFVFASGLVKTFFTDMALSVVFSVTASLVVAITVVPMLAGTYVNNVHRNQAPKFLNFFNRLLNLFDRALKKLNDLYARLLAVTIRYKKRTLAVVLVIFGLSLALVPSIGMELMPASDEGMISISVEAPKGSKTEVVNGLSQQVEARIAGIPEIESTTVSISGGMNMGRGGGMGGGGNVSSISCELVDKTARNRSTAEISEEIRNNLRDIAGAKITVSATSSSSDLTGGGVTVEIYGDDLDMLENISNEVQRQMANIEGTRQITSSITSQDQQVAVIMNKDRIRQYGMTGAEVASQINSIVSGNVATTLKSGGTETDIRLVFPETAFANYNELGDISIRTPSGAFVPLSSIVSIELDYTPTSINRLDQARYVTVTCEIFGRDMGSVGTDIQNLLNALTFPDGYIVSLAGTNEMMTDTFNTLALVIVLAIVLVYMVMAAQFESLINPFIIMFTILLALTGAILFLYIGNEPISMTSLIGCLVLIGVVVNNGIILIDFINVRRQRDGMAIEEAVLSACPIRLRPILMTALTTALGQVPLIFSTGANSEMLRGMGLVVAGGLISSTLLTLVVVPILYIYFDRISNKFKKKLKFKPRKNMYEIDAECN